MSVYSFDRGSYERIRAQQKRQMTRPLLASSMSAATVHLPITARTPLTPPQSGAAVRDFSTHPAYVAWSNAAHLSLQQTISEPQKTTPFDITQTFDAWKAVLDTARATDTNAQNLLTALPDQKKFVEDVAAKRRDDFYVEWTLLFYDFHKDVEILARFLAQAQEAVLYWKAQFVQGALCAPVAFELDNLVPLQKAYEEATEEKKIVAARADLQKGLRSTVASRPDQPPLECQTSLQKTYTFGDVSAVHSAWGTRFVEHLQSVVNQARVSILQTFLLQQIRGYQQRLVLVMSAAEIDSRARTSTVAQIEREKALLEKNMAQLHAQQVAGATDSHLAWHRDVIGGVYAYERILLSVPDAIVANFANRQTFVNDIFKLVKQCVEWEMNLIGPAIVDCTTDQLAQLARLSSEFQLARSPGAGGVALGASDDYQSATCEVVKANALQQTMIQEVQEYRQAAINARNKVFAECKSLQTHNARQGCILRQLQLLNVEATADKLLETAGDMPIQTFLMAMKHDLRQQGVIHGTLDYDALRLLTQLYAQQARVHAKRAQDLVLQTLLGPTREQALAVFVVEQRAADAFQSSADNLAVDPVPQLSVLHRELLQGMERTAGVRPITLREQVLQLSSMHNLAMVDALLREALQRFAQPEVNTLRAQRAAQHVALGTEIATYEQKVACVVQFPFSGDSLEETRQAREACIRANCVEFSNDPACAKLVKDFQTYLDHPLPAANLPPGAISALEEERKQLLAIMQQIQADYALLTTKRQQVGMQMLTQEDHDQIEAVLKNVNVTLRTFDVAEKAYLDRVDLYQQLAQAKPPDADSCVFPINVYHLTRQQRAYEQECRATCATSGAPGQCITDLQQQYEGVGIQYQKRLFAQSQFTANQINQQLQQSDNDIRQLAAYLRERWEDIWKAQTKEAAAQAQAAFSQSYQDLNDALTATSQNADAWDMHALSRDLFALPRLWRDTKEDVCASLADPTFVQECSRIACVESGAAACPEFKQLRDRYRVTHSFTPELQTAREQASRTEDAVETLRTQAQTKLDAIDFAQVPPLERSDEAILKRNDLDTTIDQLETALADRQTAWQSLHLAAQSATQLRANIEQTDQKMLATFAADRVSATLKGTPSPFADPRAPLCEGLPDSLRQECARRGCTLSSGQTCADLILVYDLYRSQLKDAAQVQRLESELDADVRAFQADAERFERIPLTDATSRDAARADLQAKYAQFGSKFASLQSRYTALLQDLVPVERSVQDAISTIRASYTGEVDLEAGDKLVKCWRLAESNPKRIATCAYGRVDPDFSAEDAPLGEGGLQLDVRTKVQSLERFVADGRMMQQTRDAALTVLRTYKNMSSEAYHRKLQSVATFLNGLQTQMAQWKTVVARVKSATAELRQSMDTLNANRAQLLAEEKAEKARLEAERLAQEAEERRRQEQEAARLEAERQAREAAEQVERDRLERERLLREATAEAERQRLAAEKAEERKIADEKKRQEALASTARAQRINAIRQFEQKQSQESKSAASMAIRDTWSERNRVKAYQFPLPESTCTMYGKHNSDGKTASGWQEMNSLLRTLCQMDTADTCLDAKMHSDEFQNITTQPDAGLVDAYRALISAQLSIAKLKDTLRKPEFDAGLIRTCLEELQLSQVIFATYKVEYGSATRVFASLGTNVQQNIGTFLTSGVLSDAFFAFMRAWCAFQLAQFYGKHRTRVLPGFTGPFEQVLKNFQKRCDAIALTRTLDLFLASKCTFPPNTEDEVKECLFGGSRTETMIRPQDIETMLRDAPLAILKAYKGKPDDDLFFKLHEMDDKDPATLSRMTRFREDTLLLQELVRLCGMFVDVSKAEYSQQADILQQFSHLLWLFVGKKQASEGRKSKDCKPWVKVTKTLLKACGGTKNTFGSSMTQSSVETCAKALFGTKDASGNYDGGLTLLFDAKPPHELNQQGHQDQKKCVDQRLVGLGKHDVTKPF